jgi:hypothetical protein
MNGTITVTVKGISAEQFRTLANAISLLTELAEGEVVTQVKGASSKALREDLADYNPWQVAS